VKLAQLMPTTSVPPAQVIQLELTPSVPVSPTLRQQSPQIMQVWFEPGQSATGAVGSTASSPAPIVSLHGKLVFGDTLVWTGADSPNGLGTLQQGGRLLVRLHCTDLFDAGDRMFSSTPGALALVSKVQTMTLPGGVFESWVFVVGG
jgi:hypothetical protein